MSDYREILCIGCAHLQVCNKSEQFQRVVKALGSVSVPTGDKGYIRLNDISWIHLGELKCDYYMHSRMERSVDGTYENH